MKDTSTAASAQDRLLSTMDLKWKMHVVFARTIDICFSKKIVFVSWAAGTPASHVLVPSWVAYR